MLSIHLKKFCKSEKCKKIRNWYVLMKIISTVSKVLFCQSNWSTYCVPILWICGQLKHHQLRIRRSFDVAKNYSEYFYFIAVSFWTYIFILAIVPLLFISVCILCKFAMLLDMYILLSPGKKRCTLLSVGTNVHIWQHIHQKY